MKIRSEYTCPLEIVHDIVKGKWKTILVFQLRNGGKSLAELQREILSLGKRTKTTASGVDNAGNWN